MSSLEQDLKSAIASGDALVVVGTGVSVGATGNASAASWVGALDDAITRCVDVVPDVPEGWEDVNRRQLRLNDLDSLLAVAETVTAKLGGRTGGEYGRWLRESVGTLRVRDSRVIDALASWGVPLATTNYDDLLEQVTGAPAVTWRQGAKAQRLVRGDEPGVLHLHGHWDDPESVILGIRSYDAILGDSPAQGLQQALSFTRNLIFVGFGAGLQDPNFGALRAWMRSALSSSHYRHFRLVREDEAQQLAAVHPPEERVALVTYGASHDDLPAFLESLRPPPKPAAPARTSRPVASARLPASRPCFGREAIIEGIVTAVLAPAPRPVPILGPPGIGKSAVARAMAHDEAVAPPGTGTAGSG